MALALVSALTEEQLENELKRRQLEKTAKKYEGYFIEQKTCRVGHHCPGPRSPGESPDWYTYEREAIVYDKSGKHLKRFSSKSYEESLDKAKKYIDSFLTDQKLKEREEAKSALDALERERQEASERLNNLEETIRNRQKFIKGEI